MARRQALGKIAAMRVRVLALIAAAVLTLASCTSSVEERWSSMPGIPRGLFAATQAELDAWDKEGRTPADWPGTEWNWLDPILLGQLEVILTGRSIEDVLADSLEPVWAGSDEGPWIFAVQPELVDALLALDAAGLRDAAEKWAMVDEMFPPKDDPEALAGLIDDVHGLLTDAVRIARAARDSGRDLFTLVVM